MLKIGRAKNVTFFGNSSGGGNATRFLAHFSAFLAPGLRRFSDFPSSLEVMTRRHEPYPNARAFMYRRFPRKMSRGNFPLEKLEFEF